MAVAMVMTEKGKQGSTATVDGDGKSMAMSEDHIPKTIMDKDSRAQMDCWVEVARKSISPNEYGKQVSHGSGSGTMLHD